MKSKIGIFTAIARPLMSDQNQIEMLNDHFLQCLFLFDVVCIESIRLKEIPYLAKLLGYDQLVKLIENGTLIFYCDAYMAVNALEPQGLKEEQLKKGEFRFGQIMIADREQYIHSCLLELLPLKSEMQKRNYQNLKLVIAENVKELPIDKKGSELKMRMEEDLVSCHFLSRETLRRRTAKKFPHVSKSELEKIEMEIGKNDSGLFTIKTNLKKIISSLEIKEEYQLVQLSCLEIGDLEKSLIVRNKLGFPVQVKDEVADLVDWKCRDLSKLVTGNDKIEKFQKILQIKGLPSFGKAFEKGLLNVEKFLEVRKSEEALAFRQLFLSDENIDAEKLCEKAESKLEKLKIFSDGLVTKTIKFAALTGLGFVAPITSVIAGTLDFAVGLTFKSDPVMFFLDRKLPSVFQLDN